MNTFEINRSLQYNLCLKKIVFFIKTIITQIISRLNKHGFINLLCSVVKFKEKIEVTDTIIKSIPVYQFLKRFFLFN